MEAVDGSVFLLWAGLSATAGSAFLGASAPESGLKLALRVVKCSEIFSGKDSQRALNVILGRRGENSLPLLS